MSHKVAVFLAVAAFCAAPFAPLASLGLAPLESSARADNSQSTAERAQHLIDSGLTYLKSQQATNGSWGGEKAPPAMSALVLRAFVGEPAYSPDTDFVGKGFTYLLGFQVEDGGIYKDLLATYNTSVAVSALAAVKDHRYQAQLDKAVVYLKKLQWTPDTRPEYVNDAEKFNGQQVVKDDKDPFFGGWGYGGNRQQGGGHGRPDLSNATMAIQALHDAGIDKNDPAMQRAVAFLTRCQNSSETNDQSWAGNDGGFIYGPAVTRLGESNAGEYTGPDGKRMLRSYGSMTYAGLKSMIYAGLTKDDPRVKAAFDWVTNNWSLDENPGMKLANPDAAKSGMYYYYFTLAHALHAYGSPTITASDGTAVDWRAALVEKLEASQRPDGSWVGDKRWMEDNPQLVTAYVVLALQEAREDLKERPAK